MTVEQLINLLQSLDCPQAEVCIFDVDAKDWEPVTGAVFDKEVVTLWSDDND